MNALDNIWTEVRVGDLGDVSTGRTPPSERPSCFGEIYPFITPGDMHQGKYASKTERGLSEEGAALLSRIKLPANSVCVSCIGWQMGEVIITDRASFTNQQINSIIPKEGYDPSYLYYSFRLRKQELLSLGSAAGARTPILNKSAFCNLKIRVPSLPMQRRIASILGSYDDLIEVNRRRIALLEEMARRLFNEWFVRFRFPGGEGDATIETPDGWLPQGWERVPVGATLDHVIGGTWGAETLDESNTKECAVIRGTDFPGLRVGGFRSIPRRFVPPRTLASRALRENDIVLEVSGGSKDQPVGRSVFVTRQLLAAIGGTCTVASFCRLVRVNVERASAYQLFWHLDHMYRARTIEAYQTQSTGLRNFQFGVFSDREFLCIPPPSIRTRFDSLAAPLMEQLATLSCQIDCLQRARDRLLPRLVSGELSVAPAERELEAVA
jgi:type I restriction enzyme, S subunit